MRVELRAIGIGTGLALLTALLYAPVAGYDFVDYDDNVYVLENEHVRQGLTRANLVGEWGRVHRGNYHPLTLVTHALDVELFGLDAGGHHVTNVVLHVASTLLLLLLVTRLTGDPWLAAWVAGVFALHPLNVQSVAWIAERKNVLSTLFWFAGLLCQLAYRRRGGGLRYLGVMACFAAGILSKPMLVTFPFTLWILDSLVSRGSVPGVEPGAVTSRGRRALEYAPFFLGALAIGIVTLLAQKEVGAVQTSPDFSGSVRLQTALGSYLWYPVKLVAPLGLSVNYLHPLDNVDPLRSLAGGIFLVAGTGLALRFRARHPRLLAGWIWYVVVLAPVCGLLTVGFQPWADRYAYVPAVGLLLGVGSVVAAATRAGRLPRIAVAGVATATLVGCFLGSRALLPSWRDSVALFGRAVEAVPGNYIAEGNLAKALLDDGRLEESLEHFRAAVAARPELASVHLNLGNALSIRGATRQAAESYRKAVGLEPGNPLAWFQLARAQATLGRPQEAVSSFERAVALAPEMLDARLGLAAAWIALGREEQARDALQRALPLVRDPELRRGIEGRIRQLAGEESGQPSRRDSASPSRR